MNTPSSHRGVAAWPVASMIVLGGGMLLASGGRVPGWERAVFRAINGLPDFLYPIVWPVQQLGAIGVVPIIALICLTMHRPRRALAITMAGVGKLGLEWVVKAMVSRQRPATSIGADIHTRGDVSRSGASFVSGHAVLVVALAGVVIPWLPARWRRLAWLPAGLVLLARVYVGAHNPLDVICGAALGSIIAVLVNSLVEHPVNKQGEVS
jgi:glycosyltransferase 2 family protein